MNAREAYEKYKHLDELLSDKEFMSASFFNSVVYNLWEGIKSAQVYATVPTLDLAVDQILANANMHAGRHSPRTVGTLLEELAELALALEGRHEHSPELELVQLGGSVINMLRELLEARREQE